MSLTKYTPEDKITLLGLAKDFIELLKEFKADPDFDKAIADAYALSEREKSRLEQARSDMSKYDALVKQNKEELVWIADARKTLEGERAEVNKLILQSNLRQSEVEKAEKKLSDGLIEYKQKENDLASKVDALKNERSVHDKNVLKLDESRKEVQKTQEILEQKVEKLKKVTDEI